MADSKITALASIGTGSDPANDPLVIVDVSDTSMAATGTTKKVTLNNLLACSPTATLASATISGDLTVDTSTLKVDSANNRVGIGTASPAKRCEINQSANAFTTIGEGEILRLIGDDGNTVGRITEIGFGTGPTGAVYAPVTLGAINTSNAGYNHKAFYIATRTGTSDVAPLERYRIANDGIATWSNVGGVSGTAMTLNSTGLGVGVASPTQKLHVKGVVNFEQVSGGTNGWQVYTYTDGTYRMNYNGAGADELIIDSSGNVGIGVTPSAWAVSYKSIEVGAIGSFANDPTNVSVGANRFFNGTNSIYKTTAAASVYNQTAGTHAWYTAPSGTAGNAITFTQAMTLDASGNLLVGTTTAGAKITALAGASGQAAIFQQPAQNFWCVLAHNQATSGDNSFVLFGTEASFTSRGSITYNRAAGQVSYNITSDYRLKEDVKPLTGALNRISSLKPSTYKFKETGFTCEGFIAHELAEVIPAAVTGEKDAVNEDGSIKAQGVDLSKVVPVLVAAIQELTARVQTLETR